MSSYKKGRRLEYKIKNILEKDGYYCIRSSGSHGIIDIIAGNGKEVLAIQSKKSGKLSDDDVEKLKKAAKKFNAIPCIYNGSFILRL